MESEEFCDPVGIEGVVESGKFEPVGFGFKAVVAAFPACVSSLSVAQRVLRRRVGAG